MVFRIAAADKESGSYITPTRIVDSVDRIHHAVSGIASDTRLNGAYKPLSEVNYRISRS